MSFIRPEILAALEARRAWAPAAVAAVIAFVLLPLGPVGLTLGAIALLAAAGLAFDAWRRDGLRANETDPGVVQIDEARIGYYGPTEGGFVDLGALTRLDFHVPRRGHPCWIFTHADGPPLEIPVGAKGADALLDALPRLPGLRLDRATEASRSRRPGRYEIWRRPEPEGPQLPA